MSQPILHLGGLLLFPRSIFHHLYIYFVISNLSDSKLLFKCAYAVTRVPVPVKADGEFTVELTGFPHHAEQVGCIFGLVLMSPIHHIGVQLIIPFVCLRSIQYLQERSCLGTEA